jgi:hypothetical protein
MTSLSNTVGHSMVTEAVTITKVDPGWKHAHGHAVAFLQHSGQPCGAAALPIYRVPVKTSAEQYCRDQTVVHLQIVTAAVSGRAYVKDIARAVVTETGCARHHWDWVRPMIRKCRRCGFVERAER